MDIKLIHLEFQFPLKLRIYEKWNVNLFNKTFFGMRKVRYNSGKKVNNLQHTTMDYIRDNHRNLLIK